MRERLIGWILALFSGKRSYFCVFGESSQGLFLGDDLDYLEKEMVGALRRVRALRELNGSENFALSEIEINTKEK